MNNKDEQRFVYAILSDPGRHEIIVKDTRDDTPTDTAEWTRFCVVTFDGYEHDAATTLMHFLNAAGYNPETGENDLPL